MKVPTTASEQSGRHFGVENIREIQLSKPDVLDALSRGRELFTLDERKRFLIRSIALKADALTPRNTDVLFAPTRPDKGDRIRRFRSDRRRPDSCS